jgi:hypothetical protein
MVFFKCALLFASHLHNAIGKWYKYGAGKDLVSLWQLKGTVKKTNIVNMELSRDFLTEACTIILFIVASNW